jgi:hypothetical protein
MKKIGWMIALLVVLAGCGQNESADTVVKLDGVVSRDHTGNDTSVFVRDLVGEELELANETELQAISKIENEKDERALNVESLDEEDNVQVYLKADFKSKGSEPRQISYADIIKIVKK